MKKIIMGLCALGVAGSASAVGMHSQKHKTQIEKELRAVIMQKNITADPLLNRTVPDISSLQAQLGMDLFFSKTLGGDEDSACVACHHPSLGGGDNLALPIGVQSDDPELLGPGRSNDYAFNNPEGGPPVPRNAPTTFNVIAWDKFQFHDGRVESLDKTPGANGAGDSGIRTPDSPFNEADPLAGNNLVQAQARFPVTSNEEMKGFNHTGYTNQTIRELLAGRLGGYGDEKKTLSKSTLANWLEKFQVALDSPKGKATDLITEQNVSMLLAEYERSQAFVDTPWKKYVEGNKHAISLNAKRGALLFYTASADGGADCSSCHQGDFFTDESFHNMAMPQIGPGKGDGPDGSNDYGRGRETKIGDVIVEADKFAFRTPSLINVEVTGPWSHAGAYTSLEAVVKHHLDPAAAVANYDSSQVTDLQFDIRNLDAMQANTGEALSADSFIQEPISLNDMQVGFLVEFLRTLTDPCTTDKECIGQWIPAENSGVHNQLNAYDQNGDML